MASRIVIEEPCEHGWMLCGDEDCPGGSRRVLTEGEVKAHIADALLFDGWTCDFHEPDPDCGICQRQYGKTAQRILDALVGGEG